MRPESAFLTNNTTGSYLVNIKRWLFGHRLCSVKQSRQGLSFVKDMVGGILQLLHAAAERLSLRALDTESPARVTQDLSDLLVHSRSLMHNAMPCCNCRPASRHGLRPASHLAPETDSDAPHHTESGHWKHDTASASQHPAGFSAVDRQQPVDAADRQQDTSHTEAHRGAKLMAGRQEEVAGQTQGQGQSGESGQGQSEETGQGQSEESGQGEMLLVEAAALGAASPGAVVRVPTSTVLSQADQIALRYQHQARHFLN